MKRIIIFICTLGMMAVLLSACGTDRPPVSDSPEPGAHAGTFVSEYGTLTFQGDGKSIVVNTNAEFEELTGLPQGEQEGSYVFLFHNEKYRYDKAEYFRIILGEKDYQFMNAWGQTTEDVIAITLVGDGDAKTILFEKKNGEE